MEVSEGGLAPQILTLHSQFHRCLLLVGMVPEEAGETAFIREPHVPDPEGHLPLAHGVPQQLRPPPVFGRLLCVLVLAVSVEVDHPGEGGPVPAHLHARGVLPGVDATRELCFISHQRPDGVAWSYYSELSCPRHQRKETESHRTSPHKPVLGRAAS